MTVNEKGLEAALLPCPLCGSPAFMDGKYWVCCNNGDCQTSTRPFETEAEAIAAWNRRADTERWAPIPTWDGFYEASTRGLIRSVDRDITHADGGTRKHRGRVLSPKTNNKGYLMVGLFDAQSKRREFRTVHRLVAATFLPNHDGLPEVNHIDGNKRNCSSSNLEWTSSSANTVHAIRVGLSQAAKLTDDQVRDVRVRAAAGESHSSIAKLLGLDRGSIRRIVLMETYSWVA